VKKVRVVGSVDQNVKRVVSRLTGSEYSMVTVGVGFLSNRRGAAGHHREYSDPVSLDTTTLHVLINGTDYTTFSQLGPRRPRPNWLGQLELPDGQNTISAQIANLATTQGAGSSTFTVDSVPPTIGFASPSAVTNNPRRR